MIEFINYVHSISEKIISPYILSTFSHLNAFSHSRASNVATFMDFTTRV